MNKVINNMNNVRNSLLLFCLIGLLVFSGCDNTSDSTLIPNILIGKWKGNVQHTDDLGSHVEEIQIDIVDSKHLYYYSSFDLESDESSALGFPLKIQLVTDKRMLLQGKINDEWNIEIIGNSLSISNGILFNKQTIVLNKVPRVGRVLALLGGILMIAVLNYTRSMKIKLSIPESIDADGKINQNRKPYMFIADFTLHAMVILFAVIAFIWGYVHTLSYFYFLGMPWRAFIVFEISLCLFVLGKKMRENNTPIESPTFSPGAFNYYLSTMLSIVSGLGLMISIITWISFVFMVWIDLGALYLY